MDLVALHYFLNFTFSVGFHPFSAVVRGSCHSSQVKWHYQGGHQKEMVQEIKNDERKCLPSAHWQLRSSITASKAFYFSCSGPNPDCARSARLVLIRWYYSWPSVTFPSCSSLATKNQKSGHKDIRLVIAAYIFEVPFGQTVDNNY